MPAPTRRTPLTGAALRRCSSVSTPRPLRALDGVRESFDRELVRKSFRIAELEMDKEPAPASWAFGERVAAEYEASLSWRVTRPLRAMKRLAGRG